MVRVKVRFVQEFYQIMKKHEIELEFPGDSVTVKTVIKSLPVAIRKRLINEKGEIIPPAEIAVNGRRIEFLDGLDTILKDGDIVLVSPRALFVV